jgi:L-ascorbate metabolism protein UlaG (beta-lactamase superfamily)
VGHSTLLLQLDGINILTDPQFSERASPLTFLGPRRRVPPVPRLDQLPPIHLVLLSHNHYDHLDRRTVRRLAAQPGGPPLFVVPLGVARWFRRQGIPAVEELAWWEQTHFDGLTLHCVPVQHWSARTSFDRNRTLWCGWVVASRELKVFFAGDTGYSDDFKTIHQRLGAMDVAAIPIGHYAPRWFMGQSHVSPEEAVRIAQDVHARVAVGIHWGTFPLTDEPLDEPPRALQDALRVAGIAPERFLVPVRGETQRIDELLRAAGPLRSPAR